MEFCRENSETSRNDQVFGLKVTVFFMRLRLREESW